MQKTEFFAGELYEYCKKTENKREKLKICALK